ncbi:DUF4232 domain-containing protein [Kitasatospora sp. NPDC052896]|uniref:DUF4232 domain-containing protein n=1 Tax=Kitasatospora sp. NPDC052896 TaxID=3364061 RepID=UPI0037C7A975
MSVRRRRPLLLSAVLVAGAGLALTACGPDDTAASGSAAASSAVVAAAPSGAAGAPASGAPVPAAPAAAAAAPAAGALSHTVAAARRTPSAASPSSAARSGGTGRDAYAAAHPCDIQHLSIHVTARPGAATQRVIEVHNAGSNACSLSSHPGVDLGNSASADESQNVIPTVPGGPGSTLRFPLPAGQSAYAVIDLDPSGATTGTLSWINELNVLADRDGTNMPLADIENFPIGTGARVLEPKLGLYRSSVADAVTSMSGASTQH